MNYHINDVIFRVTFRCRNQSMVKWMRKLLLTW